jgi:hypothetical protein
MDKRTAKAGKPANTKDVSGKDQKSHFLGPLTI